MPVKPIAILCAIAMLAAAWAVGADGDVNPIYRPAQFADGETVCNVGDSITHIGKFSSYLMLFYATRYPERRIHFVNAGIGGATTDSTLKRFDWDIAPAKPDVATVMLGMNDQGRRLYKPDKAGPWVEETRKARLAKYKDKMSELTERLENDLHARVILLTPSPYDQNAELERENDYAADDPLDQFSHWLHALAMRRGYNVVRFHTPMTEINRRMQESDPTFTLCGGDRMHPRDLGHMFMAYQLLTAQQVSPVVYDIQIDASGKVERSDNAKVTDVKRSGPGLKFTVLAASLPFPLPDSCKQILDLVPFEENLDQQILSVKGLAAGNYELLTDGESAGTFDADALAKGVNLALNNKTASGKQAQEVLDLATQWYKTTYKMRDLALVHSRVMRANIDVNDEAALTAYLKKTIDSPKGRSSNKRRYQSYQDTHKEWPEFKKQANELEDRVHQAAQPKAHVYTIQPVGNAK